MFTYRHTTRLMDFPFSMDARYNFQKLEMYDITKGTDYIGEIDTQIEEACARHPELTPTWSDINEMFKKFFGYVLNQHGLEMMDGELKTTYGLPDIDYAEPTKDDFCFYVC